jgi:chemotaxis protein MotA
MRRQGPIALEQVEIEDKFFQRGVRMIADGFSAEALRASLERERDLDHERVEESHKIFKALGDAAPGMAIALLTTLYGAVLANVFALPIADKLANRAEEEGTNRSLIIEALVMIRDGKNPATIKDELASYLPLHTRHQLLEEEAA